MIFQLQGMCPRKQTLNQFQGMFPGNELYSSLRERSPGMNFIPVSENVPWERIVCMNVPRKWMIFRLQGIIPEWMRNEDGEAIGDIRVPTWHLKMLPRSYSSLLGNPVLIHRYFWCIPWNLNTINSQGTLPENGIPLIPREHSLKLEYPLYPGNIPWN